MNNIPWRDAAALIRVRRDPDTLELNREVVFEGQLTSVVARVAKTPRDARDNLTITLPDRGARPFRYTMYEFSALIDAFWDLPTKVHE